MDTELEKAEEETEPKKESAVLATFVVLKTYGYVIASTEGPLTVPIYKKFEHEITEQILADMESGYIIDEASLKAINEANEEIDKQRAELAKKEKK
jgi:hypothetical protein